MEYKFKVGDKVRFKTWAEPKELGIDTDIRTEVHTIVDATPGHEEWSGAYGDNRKYNGTPTYTLALNPKVPPYWRVPEAMLELDRKEVTHA